MNYTRIQARVTDQTIQLVNVPLIASGGQNEVRVDFNFCNKWNGLGKTAVFYQNPGEVYPVLMTEDSAVVPAEVLAKDGLFYFGVFGIGADQVRTTEVVGMTIVKGAITLHHSEPTPEIYQQLLAAYGRTETALAVERARIDTLVAMRSADGAVDISYEPTDQVSYRHVVSSGATARVVIRLNTVTLETGTEMVIPDVIPDTFEPLGGSVSLTGLLNDAQPPNRVYVTLTKEGSSAGYLGIKIRNSSGETISGYMDLNTEYFLASVSIAELADIRIGVDGTVYPSAGAAIREQFKAATKGSGQISDDPTKALTPSILTQMYKPSFYTTLPEAVADLNAGTIGANADATADNAVCALYTDYDGNTCLTLLSDIDLNEKITFSTTVIFKVNGYTINYLGDYHIKLEGNKCVLDMQTKDSKLSKNVANVAASTSMVTIQGDECLLIGGSISYIAAACATAAALFAAMSVKSKSVVIKDCDIYIEAKNGTDSMLGIQVSGNAEMHNVSITLDGSVGTCCAIQYISNSTGGVLQHCKINATSYTAAATGIQTFAAQNYECVFKDCAIHVGSPVASSYGIKSMTSTATKVINCDIFADGIHGGDTTGTLPGVSLGIINSGTMEIIDCKVYATHSGMQCNSGSTTIINGGLYESVGHGGAYLYNIDGNFYAQNATFKASTYRGAYKDQYIYQNIDYINAAVYVGSEPGIKGFFDNCILDGIGPCVQPADDTTGEPKGGEPIRFKAGGTGNAIYASNCTFTGDGKIRFGGGGQRLYLGWANRVLCESTNPACVDTTTYARKVFTSYEEG